MNQRWRLVRVPGPTLATTDFDLVDEAIRAPADGEVRLRSIYLSLDPYQRHWLAGAAGYGAAPRPGDTPIGRAISEVVESRDARFAVGDIVLGETGWQTHPTVDAARLTRLDPTLGPLSTHVGVLGSPGLTAWVGMVDLCRPQPGQTVLVSAAGVRSDRWPHRSRRSTARVSSALPARPTSASGSCASSAWPHA